MDGHVAQSQNIFKTNKDNIFISNHPEHLNDLFEFYIRG